MLFKFILIQLTIIFTANAKSDLDTKLQAYIKTFQLKAVEKPTGLNDVKYILGEKLFFEKEISGNRNISCSTCHDPKLGTGDALPLSIGEGGEGVGKNRIAGLAGQVIPRNSPPLYNLGHKDMSFMFWDGRVNYRSDWDVYETPAEALNGDYPERWDITEVLGSALAAQALFPILSHEEMRGVKGTNEIADAETDEQAWKHIMNRLLKRKEYVDLFRKAFPNADELNIGHFGNALAHFQKHRFAVYDTPWDNYLRGDESALNTKAKNGALVFFEGGLCIRCHNGTLLGGFAFEGVASPQTGPGKDIKHNDEGRFLITNNELDRYHFRVPPLRNVALTAPYFHSGAYKSLGDVVNHYISGTRSIDNYKSDWLNDLFEKNYPQKLFV
uniref:cytochrome c peroxidase n=1 Tax=Halobacteriovorax sp. TaxID=2020862 RepID=UPI003561D031